MQHSFNSTDWIHWTQSRIQHICSFISFKCDVCISINHSKGAFCCGFNFENIHFFSVIPSVLSMLKLFQMNLLRLICCGFVVLKMCVRRYQHEVVFNVNNVNNKLWVQQAHNDWHFIYMRHLKNAIWHLQLYLHFWLLLVKTFCLHAKPNDALSFHMKRTVHSKNKCHATFIVRHENGYTITKAIVINHPHCT